MYSDTIFRIMQTLVQRSRAHRARKKLSQQQLAEQSGVSLGSLKRFETSGQISLESLLKIALTLGCLSDFDQLMEITDTPNSIDELFKNNHGSSAHTNIECFAQLR